MYSIKNSLLAVTLCTIGVIVIATQVSSIKFQLELDEKCDTIIEEKQVTPKLCDEYKPDGN